MLKAIRPALVLFILFTILTGAIYPAVITGISLLAFPHQAHGSVIERDGKAIGSSLIAQPFTDPKYFWPRASAAGYDATASSGSNFGPTNPAQRDAVRIRIEALKSADPSAGASVPADLVTASASGLDPDISLAAARYQISRVAKARRMSEGQVRQLVEAAVEPAMLGVFGEARVNVLGLNLSLDRTAK